MVTHAHLEFDITATNVTAAALSTAMAAVVLYTSAGADPVLFGKLGGCTVTSDTQDVTAAPIVKRKIVILLGAGFFQEFTNPAAYVSAFQGIGYRSTLALALSVPVTSVTEVVPTFT